MKIKLKHMKFRSYLILFSVLVCSSHLNAQNNLDKISGLSSTSASVAYSLRQLSSSYTGPLVRIKVGTLFYDVYPDATTYNFTLSSKISSSIDTYNAAVSVASANALSTIITAGTTNATVAIWYDQSGNGVHVYSSAATASIITLGSIITMNGQPTITFGTNSAFTSTSSVNYNAQTQATINAVAQNSNSISDYAGIISTGDNGGWGIAYNPNTNSQQAYSSGVPTGTYLYGYFVDGSGGLNASTLELTTISKIVTGFINKTTQTSSIYINSTIKGSNTSTIFVNPTNGTLDKIYVGQRGNFSNRNFVGNISETFIFNKILTASEQTSLETSQAIFLPPTVTITSSASGAVCAGTNITFTANVQNYTGTPTYQWYKNGAIIVGANASTYATTTLSNNDQIKVYVNGGVNNANIVSSGLKLNIDASNPGSYAGTGNTWYDLSGNNNHATLNNSPSYDAASGSIVTNGTNQYISVPQFNATNTNITMQAWVYVNLNTTGTFIKSGTGGGGYSIGIGNGAYDQVGSNVVMLLYGRGWIGTGISYGTAGWKLVTLTLDGSSTARAYVNGSLIGTYTWTSPTLPVGALNFGANIGDGNIYYNGKFAAAYFYDRALSLTEIQQNYNAFATKTTSFSSNSITVSITGSIPTISVNGDACVNKTILTTPSGLTSYAWYKDNVSISSATSSTYTPTASGVYQVTVSNGTCTNTSAATTIYSCGKTAEGKMSPITSSTTLVTIAGEINSKYGVDERGLMLTKPFANLPTGTNPVTTGLILYLDATRPASYSGTGNTWADISGLSPAGSATLVGSPVFGSGSTTNGSGSFTFGSNINASTTKTYTIDNEITYIAWVNPSTNFDGGVIVRRTDPSFNSGATSLYLYNNNLGYDWDNQNWGWRSNLTVPNNQWSMIVITVNSSTVTAYMCNASGIASASSGRGHSSLTSKGATNFYIAYDPYSPTGRAFNGKMGTAMVYSVALSSADISSIFNAQKASFGL